MKIEIVSFIFGVVLTIAIVIIVEHIYGKLFGNKKLHHLEREVRRLNKVVIKKDQLIKKSLLDMQEREKDHDG